jgi:hypothetical protein
MYLNSRKNVMKRLLTALSSVVLLTISTAWGLSAPVTSAQDDPLPQTYESEILRFQYPDEYFVDVYEESGNVDIASREAIVYQDGALQSGDIKIVIELYPIFIFDSLPQLMHILDVHTLMQFQLETGIAYGEPTDIEVLGAPAAQLTSTITVTDFTTDPITEVINEVGLVAFRFPDGSWGFASVYAIEGELEPALSTLLAILETFEYNPTPPEINLLEGPTLDIAAEDLPALDASFVSTDERLTFDHPADWQVEDFTEQIQTEVPNATAVIAYQEGQNDQGVSTVVGAQIFVFEIESLLSNYPSRYREIDFQLLLPLLTIDSISVYDFYTDSVPTVSEPLPFTLNDANGFFWSISRPSFNNPDELSYNMLFVVNLSDGRVIFVISVIEGFPLEEAWPTLKAVIYSMNYASE